MSERVPPIRAGASSKKSTSAGIFRLAQFSQWEVENFSADAPRDDSGVLELLQSGFRYALSLTHHREDAEDLTQTAWVKMCGRYGCVPSRAALFTTIRNLFIDRCRRARVVGFESWDEIPEPVASVESIALGAADDLAELLGGLRPGEREAIYLHHVEGHTAEEIGVLTRQPRNTVLSLLSRALQKLREAASRTPPTAYPENIAITPRDGSSPSSHGPA